MIDTLSELKRLLQDTLLKDRNCCALPVLDTTETVFALDINPLEIEESWKIAHTLLDRTGRYPIVSTCWASTGSFAKRVQEEDFFSRFYFQETDHQGDISPRSLIAASETVKVEDFLHRLNAQRTESEYEYDRWEDINHAELYQTNSLEGERFEWFEPENAVLLFLPTTSSWETLAYLHWFGAYESSKFYIALGKSWEERFGALLVAHYGTMLQCLVSRPPQTPDVALALALEHDLVAPCTLALPGVSLRHYAQGLLHCDRWFLHERP